MITNQEQRDNELLYLLSEGLSEYLQGYKLEQGGPAFDTLETASLNLTPELGRQGFKKGGGIGEVVSDISDTVSEISSNVPGTAQAAIGLQQLQQQKDFLRWECLALELILHQ